MADKLRPTKCLYTDVCYLAESLQCYGYKVDCILYTKSTGGAVTAEDFHKAINELINRTQDSSPKTS